MAAQIVTLMVEREELMMAPARDGMPIYRPARFLHPSLNAEGTSPTVLIPSTNTISSNNPDVFFDGWRMCTHRWEQWVSQMRPLYQTLWERAGIADAITGSVCTIIKHKEVILELSNRWCSETKSFIFPWGEATITLEDVAVIGGYSLGDYCVLKPLETPELKDVETMLKMERLEIGRTKAARACQYLWMNKFMGTGSNIEHEAFLSLWLSRFVFTGPAINTIRTIVFPVAIHLSRGTKMALAPAVLASLYRDLHLLKRREQCRSHKPSKSMLLNKITLWAPFQLVQAWIWERFESLRPQDIRTVHITQPLICRWNMARIEGLENENIVQGFDRSEKNFLWRPYTIRVYEGFMSELYGKKILRVLNTSLHREALMEFARCIRVSELVGVEVDCIEQYLPHRVAMQFGFDQDIPISQVDRENATSVIAWRNYVRPIVDHIVDVPSRFCKPEISTRYYICWNRSIRIYLQRQPTNRNEVDRGGMVPTSSSHASTSAQPPSNACASQTGSTFILTTDPFPPPGFSSKMIFAVKSDSGVIYLPFRPT
ncbi:uncharacterized protein LOC124943381 [Impatiens glandulifera]|uniref:uncharacterized protein LOC124943381 n=1 Tax=Impatiens glandulifera TaxID=253017 RepID=UPI001FB0DBF9|nr:uncharacterized protein LOC124943381 [Impatiens glandulifera]